QSALRQPQLHDPDQRSEPPRKRCGAGDAVPPLRNAGVSMPLPLAGGIGGVLGQSRRAAPRNVGLFPAAPPRPPRHGQGRPPVLTKRLLPLTLPLSPSNGERERDCEGNAIPQSFCTCTAASSPSPRARGEGRGKGLTSGACRSRTGCRPTIPAPPLRGSSAGNRRERRGRHSCRSLS